MNNIYLATILHKDRKEQETYLEQGIREYLSDRGDPEPEGPEMRLYMELFRYFYLDPLDGSGEVLDERTILIQARDSIREMLRTVFDMDDYMISQILEDGLDSREYPQFYRFICQKPHEQNQLLWDFGSYLISQYDSLKNESVGSILNTFTQKDSVKILRARPYLLDEIRKAMSNSKYLQMVAKETRGDGRKDHPEDICASGADPFREFLENWTPSRIISFLDTYMIGQDAAKNAMAHLCYEHIARIAHPGLRIRKTNYLMFGPTGCGKTEICRLMRRILPVPIEIVDASAITKNGFLGLQKEDLMLSLFQLHKNMGKGIVVLDEFDKLCRPNQSSNGDISPTLQGQLLKMIEGTVMRKSSMHMQQGNIQMNTEDITFICAGAFVGLMDKEKEKSPLGFTGTLEKKREQMLPERLVKYGMIPELAGRISSYIELKDLSEEDLYMILTSAAENSLENIRKLFRAAYGLELQVSDEALRLISHHAYQMHVGARALNSFLEQVCRSALSIREHNGSREEVLLVDGSFAAAALAPEEAEYSVS